MDLEPRTLETVGSRCEECGASLTSEELRVALERGGPALCSVHATETILLEEEDGGLAPPAA